MPRKRKRTHVNGPYPHRRRWRLMLTFADGSKDTQSFATKAEAEGAKSGIETALAKEDAWAKVAQLEAQLEAARTDAENSGQARTVQDMIDAFQIERRGQVSANTDKMYRFAFKSFLGPILQEPAASITSARATALYRAHAANAAVASQRTRRKIAAQLWRFGAERGWVKPDVWSKVKPIGRPNRGKPQPRFSEAEVIYNKAFEIAEREEGTRRGLRALVVISQITLALRSSELTSAVGRDIDSGLWYQDRGKTENSTRIEEIPTRLLPLLNRRAEEVGPDGRVFPYRSGWPNECAAWICKEVGISRYTAHAMRGLHASLSAAAGITSHEIARTLGHGGIGVTEAHYISADAKRQRSAKQRSQAFSSIDLSAKSAGKHTNRETLPTDISAQSKIVEIK